MIFTTNFRKEEEENTEINAKVLRFELFLSWAFGQSLIECEIHRNFVNNWVKSKLIKFLIKLDFDQMKFDKTWFWSNKFKWNHILIKWNFDEITFWSNQLKLWPNRLQSSFKLIPKICLLSNTVI